MFLSPESSLSLYLLNLCLHFTTPTLFLFLVFYFFPYGYYSWVFFFRTSFPLQSLHLSLFNPLSFQYLPVSLEAFPTLFYVWTSSFMIKTLYNNCWLSCTSTFILKVRDFCLRIYVWYYLNVPLKRIFGDKNFSYSFYFLFILMVKIFIEFIQ